VVLVAHITALVLPAALAVVQAIAVAAGAAPQAKVMVVPIIVITKTLVLVVAVRGRLVNQAQELMLTTVALVVLVLQTASLAHQ
jgi:hypothetical protein